MEVDASSVSTLNDDGLVMRLERFSPHEELEALEAARLSE